jgi:transposase InsO family protein
MEAISGRKTIQEIAVDHATHHQIVVGQRDPDQPQPSTKPHAPHGFAGDLPETPHHGSRRSIHAIPPPGRFQGDHCGGSSLGHRHHLHPAAERLPLPGAIVDLFSRNVLSWKISNSLDTEFCLDALEMALEGGWRPEIFHSDQG